MKTCTTTSNKWENNNRPHPPAPPGRIRAPVVFFYARLSVAAPTQLISPASVQDESSMSHTSLWQRVALPIQYPTSMHARSALITPIKPPYSTFNTSGIPCRPKHSRRHSRAQKKCAGAAHPHTQKKQAALSPPARHYTGHANPRNHAQMYCNTTKTHPPPSCSHPVPAGNP